MECLPQIVRLVEVLSFLVEKLPTDLKTKNVYEEYLKVVNKIVGGDDTQMENIIVKEDLEDYGEYEEIQEQEGGFDEDDTDENFGIDVYKSEEMATTPVLIKFESSGAKFNMEAGKRGKTKYTGGTGSFPKVNKNEILLYNCVFCEENLETETFQEEHDKMHHIRDDKYFCPHPECVFVDDSKMKVMTHFTKDHRNLTLRVCSLCKQAYLTTPLLRKHVLDAHGKDVEYEQTCPTCFETFETTNILSHHMQYEHIHGNLTCRSTTCNRDGNRLEFETKAEFDAHKKEKHIILESYTCEQCGEEFTGAGRRTKFKRHVQLHTMTEKKYHCSECDKKFFWENEFNEHWRLKHGEMRFMCTQCDFRTRTKTRLIKHMIVHSEERSFQCSVCPLMFKTESYLRKHMHVHSDVRAFKCEFCVKTFKMRKTLTEHRKIHTQQFSAFCKICDKGFVQKYNLKLHNDKYHPHL